MAQILWHVHLDSLYTKRNAQKLAPITEFLERIIDA